MKKILLFTFCAIIPFLTMAQNMKTEGDAFPRTEDEYWALKAQQPKLVLLVGWPDEDNALYAAPDPERPGEILLFYRAMNHHYEDDELYIVFDKDGCRALRSSLGMTLEIFKEWKKTALRNKINRFQKAIDVQFPDVNIYWRRTRPRFRKITYSPLFMWAGKGDWLKPEFRWTTNCGSVDFLFNLQDNQALEPGVIQPVEIRAFDYEIKDYLKWLDYDKLKKLYIEKTPDRSKWDELFK